MIHNLFFPFLYIAGGFALLYYGGDWLVLGAVRMARKLNVSPVIIALTVVAFGTSLPELLVSLLSALTGHPTVAVGNILGSNIYNICLVGGLCALIANPMLGDTSVSGRDTGVLIAGTILFGVAGMDLSISRFDGIGLSLLFLGYMFYVIMHSKSPEVSEDVLSEEAAELLEEFPEDEDNKTGCYRWVLAGLITLPIGAHILVKGGIEAARILGISERFISMTVVSWGTSLPELATSIAAALRGHSAMCVGNIVGSNIFNTLAIGGITALFIDIKIEPVALRFDYTLVCFATMLFCFLHRGGKSISRIEGSVLLIVFAVMLYFLRI